MKKILTFAILTVVLASLSGCEWFQPKPAADETSSTASDTTATLEITEGETAESTATLTIEEATVVESTASLTITEPETAESTASLTITEPEVDADVTE
jgi:uncharacterized lipoprotein